MVKSNERLATVEHEFALLEKALNQTANDTARCLKLLKKNLSDYDNHHGNHFINTATVHMRSDMRTAKDTALDLKHVAHEINKNPQPSEVDIDLARNIMDVVVKAMNVLTTTARNYDEKNGRSKGVQGVIDNAVGKNDKERHEKDGGLFGNSDKHGDTGLFSDRKTDASHSGGLHTDVIHHHHGGILSSSDTVEHLVKTTLHNNFSINALSQQITSAEKSLSSSPTFVERVKEVVHDVKEVVHDVKDKLKGDKTSPTHKTSSTHKTSPTYVDHHGNKHVVVP